MRLLQSASMSVLLLIGFRPLLAQAPPFPEGWWEGAIATPMPIGIRCELRRGEGGAYRGAIDIPQQGALGLPLEAIAFDAGTVSFAIAGVPGEPTFTGRVDGERIVGSFTQNGSTFGFELTRQKGAAAAPLRRPQLPERPFPYREEEVSFGHDEVSLAGTLTLPQGEGPFPALMLFSGSGFQDRDSTLFGHKSFLVLADRLTRAGFAVLRADDRGVGGSKGDLGQATTADFIEDARSGIRYLEGRPEIDKKRLGMFGHSEGALVAAGVAARGELAFVILAAGSGVKGSELVLEQLEALSLASGMAPEQVEAAVEQTRQAQDLVLKAATPEEAKEKVIAMGLAQLRRHKGEAEITEAEKAAVEHGARQAASPWVRHFLAYDPAEALEKIKIPVLILQGGLDLQVPAAQNLPKIEEALRKAGNGDVTIRSLPGLNHLLQPAKTGLPSEYAEIETTLDESALEAIIDFLARFRSPAPKISP